MIKIRRSAIVRYSPEQMFDLVNDIEAYPERFSWCESATIEVLGEGELRAHLKIGMVGIRVEVSTHNRFKRPQRIDLDLVDGPFSKFHGVWTFLPLGTDGCKVALALDFKFGNSLFGSALKLGFQGLADHMVDDFCEQAKVVYG